MSPSFVSQLENSKSQPSVATLYSISQLLDVSIDELFSTDELHAPAAASPSEKVPLVSTALRPADRPTA